MKTFRHILRGPIGRVLTMAIAVASFHAFVEPGNYLYALEVQRQKEADIRAIAARMNVDPEFLLNPQGRTRFDFRSLFAQLGAELGLQTQSAPAANDAQPTDIRESIKQVKERYALVAADTTLARIAQLVQLSLTPENLRGKSKGQIKAELNSVLRLADKDFLPAVKDNTPGIAKSRDNDMRREIKDVQKRVKSVLNAPHALDDANLEATLAQLRAAVEGTITVRNSKPRWTRDPFPVKDTYRFAPTKSVGPRYEDDPGATSTPSVVTQSTAAPSRPALRPVSNAVPADVAALANTLATPAKIFSWVHDNIDWESYSGVAKGSLGTLHERRGNDWDQALLLRDLLAARGYDARLEWGRVTLPMAKAMNLAGTEDPLQAANLLATAGFDGIVLTAQNQPIAIQMTHVWVRAHIPYIPNRGATAGTPDTWVRMDPSFKRYEYQPGIAINGKVLWNEDEYLQTSSIRPPAEFYGDKIWNHIRTNNIDCVNLSQVTKAGRIKAMNFPFVPATLTTRIESVLGVDPAVPASQLQSVTMNVTDINGAVMSSYTTSLADVWGKKLSITFPPATADDAATIAAYGGLFNTPAYLIKLKPVFSIDDQPVADGSPVPAGAVLDLNTTFRQPNVADDFTHHELVAGETHAIVLDPGAFPDSLLESRINRLKTLTNEDAVLSEKLFLVGLRYMQHVDDGIAFAAGVRWQRPVKRVFEADVRRQIDITYNVAGAAIRLNPAENNIDVSRLLVGIVPINNDLSNRASALALAGLQSSYLEGAIWEEMESQQGISAAKALLLSRMAGQQIHTVNASNVNTVLNSVNLSADVENEIRGAVAQGRIAKIASANLQVNRWNGTGYILQDPQTGAATYPISGGLAGGSGTGATIAYVQDVLGSEPWLAGSYMGKFLKAVFSYGNEPTTVQSDPVNMASGNMYRFANDFTIFARGLPVGITRTYNSRSDYNGPFGYGWTFNYGDQIIRNEDGSLLYRDADGSEHRIALVNGEYVAPAGKHITITASPSGYTVRLRDGVRHLFDANGRIAAQVDLNGNTVTINRNGAGNPATLTDDAGRTMLTFNVTNGKITGITDLAGRTTSYGYDGDDLVSFTDVMGKVWTMSYDLAHNMTSFADPLGNTQSFDYDVDDRLMRHEDAEGGEELFQYDQGSRSGVVTDRRGGDVLVQYDEAGRALLQADPAGNVSTSQWDANNNRTTITDSRGFTTSFEYDASGNVTKRTNPDGGITTATYDSNSRVLTSTAPSGLATTNSYDSAGNLTAVAQAIGGVTRITTNTFDASGQVLTTVDPNGNDSSFGWSSTGFPASRTDAADQTTTITSDALGRVISTKDAAGVETRLAYDNADRVIEETDPYGQKTTISYDDAGRRTAIAAPNGTMRFTYDGEGRVLTVTDASGAKSSTAYNAAGDVIAETDARGNTARYEYDLAGRRTKIVDAAGGTWSYGFCGSVADFCEVTDPLGRVTRRQFDSMGRVTSIRDSLSHVMTTQYDRAGRRIAVSDANGHTTRYTYDESGHVLTVTDAAGGVITYTYDRNGNKTSQKDANGHVTSWTYDGLNRAISETSPAGRVASWTYDAGGHMATRKDAKGQTTRYTYEIGRLKIVTYPDGSTETITRDAFGRPITVTNPNVTYTYTYDVLHHIKSVKNERVGYLISYEYDSNGNRSKMTTPQSTTVYTYDGKNRLAAVNDTFFGKFTFTYDASDRRTGLQYPNGIKTSYEYDNAYRVTAMVSNDALGAVVDAWSYQYDAVGNRTSKTDYQGRSEVYAYDAADRLAKAVYANGNSESFTYDPAGNRLSLTDQTGVRTDYTYDVADRMLTAGATSFTYDLNGNQITKATAAGTTTLAYDFNNRVTSITGPNGNESNKYDALGRRMEMAGASIENGLVRPQYDLQGNPIADSDGSNGMWTYRLYGPGLDEPLAEWRRVNNRITYVHRDALNSVTAVTTTDGKVAYRQTYTAFGAMSRTGDNSGIPPTRLGFTGRETSVGSLVQYRNRYYDTSTGRFTSQDPAPPVDIAPPSLNRYVYAFNSPVNLNDPTGMVVPLLWAFYFLALELAPVLIIIFLCFFAFVIGYWIGTLIRQLWGDPAMTDTEADVLNVMTGIAALGLALITATFPNVRTPGFRENVGYYTGYSSPPGYGYTSPYSRGGDCVKAAQDFTTKFGGQNKFSPIDRVQHVAVEYEGQVFDPTIRGNLSEYGRPYEDIPEWQQWFSPAQHDELVQRLPPVVPGS